MLEDIGHCHEFCRAIGKGDGECVAGRACAASAATDERDLCGVVGLAVNHGKRDSRKGAYAGDFATVADEGPARYGRGCFGFLVHGTLIPFEVWPKWLWFNNIKFKEGMLRQIFCVHSNVICKEGRAFEGLI
jgi:hypothetical protein